MSEQPILFTQSHHAAYLNELIEFLRLPSISTQPDRAGDVAAAAAWLARAMSAAGLENVRLIDTAGHPIVYGDWLHAGADKPTVLIYGHYDVQPPEPLELWESPPFTPVVRDQFLYARGASDDKGQVYVHVKVVEAYLQTLGRLPVNVKFLVEGEEEIGSKHLHAFISEQRSLLAADSALVSDSSILAPDMPALVYGLRGICQVQLDLTGPTRDLHSGAYGGGIDNPINVLGHLIAKLKDERGHVLIPGFYDQIRPLTLDEREMLAAFPLDEAGWLAETGAPTAWGEPEYTLVERLGARPTLDVTGIIGGYTGVGVKTVLPAHAQAKISMRLVPNQDPAQIIAHFEQYVRAILPTSVTATINFAGGSPAALLETDTPTMRAAAQAYEATFGRPPVFMREGGSIPVVNQFAADLGLPTVLMGFGLPDDRIHSPNERFYLPNYYRGIETAIRYLDLLGNATR